MRSPAGFQFDPSAEIVLVISSVFIEAVFQDGIELFVESNAKLILSNDIIPPACDSRSLTDIVVKKTWKI